MKYDFRKEQPIFADKHGDLFVFWQPEEQVLMIAHGRRVTLIDFLGYIDADDGLEFVIRSKAHKKRPDEKNFYDSRGRVIASYSQRERLLFIFRDGRVCEITTPGKVYRVYSLYNAVRESA